jgi:hypothetical protein
VNRLNLNRTQILVLATALLIVFAVVHHIWADWGLITIHAKGQPLGKVVASIERQGHARIETDMPRDTPVTMDCVKVPLTDALETLSVTTESRWRLLYFVAGDKSAIKTAEVSWFGGQKPDGWKMLSFPMGNFLALTDEEAPPLDPRGDLWNPRTAAPAAVQAFFNEAAQATNASFAFPESWNPTVKSAPPSGTVERAVPKLVRAAGGRLDQLFFLSKNRRGPRPDRGGGDGPGAGMDFDLMAERMQSEINRLPDDQRGDAQAQFDAQQAFRKSLANMSEDDRRQAFQQHMQDPQVQQQMINRMDSQDSRMNHDQRMQRTQNFVNRKLTAMGKL